MTPERLAEIGRWLSENQGSEAIMGPPPFGSTIWTWEAVADLRAEVERLTAELRIAWAALNSCRSAALAGGSCDRLRARVLDETAAALAATEGEGTP